MNELFKGKNWKIMKEILYDPSVKIHVRNVAKKLKVSPSSVSQTVKTMIKLGMAKRKTIDIDNPRVRGMKFIFNTETVIPLIGIIQKKEYITGFGMYGSWANGTNNGMSDLDLWIKTRKYPEVHELAGLRAIIRKKMRVEPSILVLTDKRVEEFRKNNPPLYFSLINSFKMWGEHL